MIRFLNIFHRRRRWKTPPGYYTTFAAGGDPMMDSPGRRQELYGRLFSTGDGRAVLADILAVAGVGWADFEPGMDRDTSTWRSGVKANALSIARTAGLDTGALGRALITGKLEAMTDAHETIPRDE